jgi:Asp/Glu/hydantoin racemase
MAAPSSQISILIINPNTSTSMTAALEPVVRALPYPNATYTFFTSPSHGIPSINSPSDAVDSASICWPALQPLIHEGKHTAYLVACYSAHPLVGMIREEIRNQKSKRKAYVTGIFEASVAAALGSLSVGFAEAGAKEAGERFGIVSTGKVWEDALSTAVGELLVGSTSVPLPQSGSPSALVYQSPRFAGCETTGLNATELHDLPAEEVRAKMKDATVRLLKTEGGRVGAICLGCAGMVGLDSAVREGCVEVFGEEVGAQVRIVDGVVAGVGSLVSMAASGF